MAEKPIARISRATPLMPWLDHYGACKDDKKAAQKAGWATLGEAWNQCSNVGWLLWGLAQEGYSDDPVLRLFACRCIRETPLVSSGVVGDLLTDPRSWAALEVAERFARGQVSDKELAAARTAAVAASASSDAVVVWAAQAVAWAAQEENWAAAEAAAWAVQLTAGEVACEAVWAAEEVTEAVWAEAQAAAGAARTAAAKFQANLLRQMINPFNTR